MRHRAIGLQLAAMLAGCGHPRGIAPSTRESRPAVAGRVPQPSTLHPQAAPPEECSGTAASLPLDVDRARLAEMVVDSQRKRVMGRLASLPDVQEIIDEDGPLVQAASHQPETKRPLEQIAQDEGISVEEARQKWCALQEADLMLESGGHPDDVSVAHAVGVAQWIYETGKHAGLRIDPPASNALTSQIDPLKLRLAWLEYLAKPGSDPHAPGAPPLSRAQAAAQIPALRKQVETLRARRRTVDQRYDPRPAIAAHTVYLLGLYPRFPSLDWVFQAFHGGEAGVQRTLQRFLGPAWPGSTAAAIRDGGASHKLTYQNLYFGLSPQRKPEAFSYIYGRSDDHRWYWWKLRAAQDAIALYRQDPAAFRATWVAYLPGRAKEAMYYPNGPAQALHNVGAVQQALHSGRIRRLSGSPDYVTSGIGVPALRPAALGALRLVLYAYHRAGGRSRVTLGDLTVPQDALRAEDSRYHWSQKKGPPEPPKPKPPGGGPPGDFDYHATGIAFDIRRPADQVQRKILEYALGYFTDREILWWMDEKHRGPRHYHVVPNPRYGACLAAILRSGPPKRLPGL